jgi:putative nucleotidyltransferase with HDIG domain
MTFAQGPFEALKVLEDSPVDVVISDLMMPEMSGYVLLEIVQRDHPRTIRLALTGDSSMFSMHRASGPVHRFLNKPCSFEVLEQAITRALYLRKMLPEQDQVSVLNRIEALPSLPAHYQQLVAELETAEPSFATIESIIAADVSLSLKVMQMVNSAIFGLRREITSVNQAVTILGLNAVRELVLSTHIFCTYSPRDPDFDLAGFEQHSLSVAHLAQQIARTTPALQHSSSSVFAAGLFHDVGKLVAAVHFPQVAHTHRLALGSLEDERVEMGMTHTEIGAYLLSLWGFPDSIIDSVAWHHAPSSSGFDAGVTTAVHVANALILAKAFQIEDPRSYLDMEYLMRIGLSYKITDWLAML